MWTATLTKVERIGYMIHASFELVEDATGERITDKTFADNLTEDRLAEIIEARVKSLEARDAAFAAIERNVGQIILLPRDRVLTPEEQAAKNAKDAADAFFVALGEFNTARASFEKGLVQQSVVDAKAVAVKTLYLPEYEKDPRFR